jgi:polyphenol oxidase
VPSRDHPDYIYRVPRWEQFHWLEHGFATRHTNDWPDVSRLATAQQVHSATVLTADDGAGQIGVGDAIITDRPGRLVGVRTADCVPILLVDPVNRAVAAVHAGWRGTAVAIVRCTISEMTGRFGTVPLHVLSAIGPAIGKCCYEVGSDVAGQFVRWMPEIEHRVKPVNLDLEEANRRQLIEAGVQPGNIFAGAPCTFCTADTFHSYRRDKDRAGRMISCIGIRGN